ncbi:hypothetical protein BDZ91DRAFT_804423 [Kalaharituber pfeilii]|nr:hypothetical protein BDZ91DRAFT_804423 [Kalaharituber pfeilii]
MASQPPRDDSMKVTSPLGSQPFDELEEHEDSVHESIEGNPEYESMETAPVIYAPGLLSGATIPKAIKPAEVPLQGTLHVQFQPLLPTPKYPPSQFAQQQYLWQHPYLLGDCGSVITETKRIALAGVRIHVGIFIFILLKEQEAETLEMAAFQQTANETAQKLKAITEQTSGEAQKALTDMANFQIQYHQQRKDDQETTVHNLEVLKDELLDVKFTNALLQQKEDLVTEFASQINSLITEFNKMSNTLGALVKLAQAKRPDPARPPGNTPPAPAPSAAPFGSNPPPSPDPRGGDGGGGPPPGGH